MKPDDSLRRSIGPRGLAAAGAALLLLAGAPASAQVDISGDWDSQVNEDQPHRGPGAELGDYTGLSINAAAQQKATVWDASVLSLPERMAQPHPPQYFMRGPGPNMRITKRIHPVTGALVAFTLEGPFGRDDRVIWMDGRPHPPEDAEHLWTGFSTGEIVGNQLVVTTTHMKYGVIQRNGVPASYKSVMIEQFIRHGDLLVSTTIIDDPTYLEEPFIRTQQWERSSNINPDQRWIFEIVEEAPEYVLGDIPHWPLGVRQDEFSRNHGIPYEATLGGAATLYPEFQEELERMMRENPVQRPEGR